MLRQVSEAPFAEQLAVTVVGVLVLIAFALLTRNVDKDSEDSQ